MVVDHHVCLSVLRVVVDQPTDAGPLQEADTSGGSRALAVLIVRME